MPGIDRHSRIVGWLKVGLPLIALALLSTLFLVADRIDPDDAIPFAQVDVEDLANDPRMTAPSFAGTTRDGGALTLTATTARPARADQGAMAEGVTAEMTTPDGGKAEISAGQVHIDNPAGLLRLGQGVVVTTSTGYRIVTDAMEAALDRTRLESRSKVKVESPSGPLVADGFTLTPRDPGENPESGSQKPYLLVFQGGVKLVYQPGG